VTTNPQLSYQAENSLFFVEKSLLLLQKFPVPWHREFCCKPLNWLADWTQKSPWEA
jgi:hypothetical protein